MRNAIGHHQQCWRHRAVTWLQQIKPVGAFQLRQQSVDLLQAVTLQRHVEHPIVQLRLAASRGQHQNQLRRVILSGECLKGALQAIATALGINDDRHDARSVRPASEGFRQPLALRLGQHPNRQPLCIEFAKTEAVDSDP
ncbi:hypothetical protein D3C87_1220520 [compost metagenome]